jgi:hypothetical protein
MTETARSRAALAVTALVAAAIGYFTLAPLAIPGPPGGDKLHHLVAFGALVLPATVLRPRWALGLLAFAAAYGGLIEIVQPHVGRHGEWADFAANGAGAALGVLAGRGLARAALRPRGG